jgi:hypothetical protein
MKLNLWLLSAVAMWRPLDQAPVYWALNHVTYLLPFSAFAFWFRELGTVVRMRNDATQFLGYAGLFGGHSVSLYKWCALVSNRKQLRRLVDSLTTCLKTGAAAEGTVQLRPFTRAADIRATILTVCWMLCAMYVIIYWSLTALLHGDSTSR